MGRIRSVHFPLKLTAKTANFKEKAASKKKDATKSVKPLQISTFLIKRLKGKKQLAKQRFDQRHEKVSSQFFQQNIGKESCTKPCV